MKRILLLMTLLLPLAAAATRPAKAVPRARIESVIREFRAFDGVEVVRLGRLATGALKSVVRISGASDPDTRVAADMMRGVKGMIVVDYEDCAPSVRERLARRLDRALEGGEILMEFSDGGSRTQLFGLVDEQAGTVRDFVLHAPDECSLVCVFGTVSLDAVSTLVAHE